MKKKRKRKRKWKEKDELLPSISNRKFSQNCRSGGDANISPLFSFEPNLKNNAAALLAETLTKR